MSFHELGSLVELLACGAQRASNGSWLLWKDNRGQNSDHKFCWWLDEGILVDGSEQNRAVQEIQKTSLLDAAKHPEVVVATAVDRHVEAWNQSTSQSIIITLQVVS